MTAKPPPPPLPPPADFSDVDDEPKRHPPRPVRDRNPIESLGESISEVVTGPLDDATGKPASDPAAPKR